MRTTTRRGLAAAIFAACMAVARFGDAAPAKDVEGYVLTWDSGDVVVDVGSKTGAQVGDVVELWRPLKLKHPVTGKMVTDRFRIGTLKLVQVRDQMSLAQPDGALARPVAVGDVVVLRGTAPLLTPAPTPSTTPPATPPTAAPGPAMDAEEAALSAMFEQLRGASVEKRIAAYEAYAKQFPSSRFRVTLEEEAAALRLLMKNAGAPQPQAEGSAVALSFDAPGELIEGAPATLAVEVGGDVKGVLLQIQHDGETAFVPLAMKPAGKRYWRITLPKEQIRAPGFQYFIEAVLPSGATVAIEGNAKSARSAKVVAAPKVAPPRTWLSTASIWSDYASYNLKANNDWAWQTEGFFGMRFGDVGLRAVRSGFGVYKGRGGSLAELDPLVGQPGRDGRQIGLSYGYIEGEWAFSPTFSLAGRAVVGLTEDGVTGGAQSFVRIGNDRKTNLLLGGEFLGGVGLRGITQLELLVFPRFPILFRTEVTNQPAGVSPDASRQRTLTSGNFATDTADLGLRGIVQLGWKAIPSPADGGRPGSIGMTFFLRGSYQGRTINHAGPGGGAGVQVEW
jgi:hypothetical protein